MGSWWRHDMFLVFFCFLFFFCFCFFVVFFFFFFGGGGVRVLAFVMGIHRWPPHSPHKRSNNAVLWCCLSCWSPRGSCDVTVMWVPFAGLWSNLIQCTLVNLAISIQATSRKPFCRRQFQSHLDLSTAVHQRFSTPSLFQTMAWRRKYAKSLPDPWMAQFGNADMLHSACMS